MFKKNYIDIFKSLEPIKSLGILVLLATFVLVLVIGHQQFLKSISSTVSDTVNAKEQNFTQNIALKPLIEQPSIKANSAVVWDKKTNSFLFNKNGNIPLPIASISKLLTAIVAIESIPQDYSIEITVTDLITEGEAGHILGEIWNRDDLIAYMLIVSSNDASTALLRTSAEITQQTEVSLLEQISNKIGLASSSWQNASGLDVIDGEIASNKASAIDVIKLLDYASENYPAMTTLTGDESRTFTSSLKTYKARSTNQLAGVLPHTTAAKTGYTLVAGGNLVLMAEAGLARPIYIVVLDSTFEERFSDTEKLYNYSVKLIQS